MLSLFRRKIFPEKYFWHFFSVWWGAKIMINRNHFFVLHARLWESATAEHLSLLTLPDSDSGCRILFFVVGNFPFILSKLM
jgi:hypothetical protein